MPRLEVVHDDELDRARPVLIHRIPGESLRQINDAVPTGNVQCLHLLRRRVENRPGRGDQPPVIPGVLLAKGNRMIHVSSPFPCKLPSDQGLRPSERPSDRPSLRCPAQSASVPNVPSFRSFRPEECEVLPPRWYCQP